MACNRTVEMCQISQEWVQHIKSLPLGGDYVSVADGDVYVWPPFACSLVTLTGSAISV